MADILLSVGLQKGAAGTSQIERDLDEIIGRINKNPPRINIGLNVSDTALKAFRTRLQQIVNTVALTNGAPITVNISGLGEVSAQANSARAALNGMGDAARAAGAAAQGAANANANAAESVEQTAKRQEKQERQRQHLLQSSTRLLTQMQIAERNWTKASTGNTREQYTAIQSYISQVQTLRTQFESGAIDAATFRARLDTLKTGFFEASLQIKRAGEDTKSLKDHFSNLASKFGAWLSVSQMIMLAVRQIRKMVNNVINLDKAMTELKKVTTASDAAYTRFLVNATTRAKALGATLTDVVEATSEFARLGYEITDASVLADAALVYKNVGDGIDDITQASESIISTMQAFQIKPDNVMHIVDVFNSIGNNFAISSGGIGEALQRSAAAMHAAGNTLEETSALVAAANTVLQNPETVGTTLKTVSMYLRAAKTEAEEAGESTDGMADSVSELRQELLALTGQQVDIQIDKDNFKSTYDILKELSRVWDTIDGISKANILEMIAGKRNANAVAAILENFEIAEEALTVATNSTGSALKENEIYLDSIAGKISKFKAAWQALSNTIIDSNLVKGVVDFGTALFNVINWIDATLGGFGKLLAMIPLSVAAFNKFKTVQLIINTLKTSLLNFVGGAK